MSSSTASAPRVSTDVEPYVSRQELAGAVLLVTDKEKNLTLEAVGFSDVAARTPMRTDAMFWIASMTKPMTGTALIMLVDEGKVDIEDPVEKYLPEFKGQMMIAEQDEEHVLLKPPAHPITVKNILTHTGGLPFHSLIEEPTLDMVQLPDAVRSYAMSPLQFEPDTQFLYSNAGINTAARIVEVVSGMTYPDYLQQRLLDPLGMTETTFWPSEAQVQRLAKTYGPNEANNDLVEKQTAVLHYPLTDPRRSAMPAGGLFSTAEDVAKFCRMILNGGELDGHLYLSEAAVKLMTSRHTTPDLPGRGLSWVVDETSFGHNGALGTMMTIHPGHGLATLYLVQHMGYPGEGAYASAIFREAALAQFSKNGA